MTFVAEDTYKRLIELLDQRGARYRLIDHPPEGRTEVVSPMRGNDLRDAAKCMILMIKLGKKTTKYVLAVVPGDRRVSLPDIKALFGATYVSFASAEIAERLAGSVAGTILPFVLNGQSELELIVDPSIGKASELFFNAARLDRSVALNSKDYLAIAKPRIEQIAEKAKAEFVMSTPLAVDFAIHSIGSADHALWEPLWKGYLEFYDKPISEEMIERAWRRISTGEIQGFLAIGAGDEGLGLVHYFYHTSTSTTGSCYIQDLFVAPSARRCGVGRKLIASVVEAAKDKKVAVVYWQTEEFNATARRLYERISKRSPFIRYQIDL
jgi:Ala-tRNA(Pro) deacylase